MASLLVAQKSSIKVCGKWFVALTNCGYILNKTGNNIALLMFAHYTLLTVSSGKSTCSSIGVVVSLLVNKPVGTF